MKNIESTKIWELYQKGVDQHNIVNMYDETEKQHDFYIGNQWRGAKTGGEDLPILNFIKPVVKYKVSMIAQSAMSIVYSAMTSDPTVAEVCEKLNDYAASQWEKLKMDSVAWSVLKNCAIAGDHYVYVYDKREPTDGLTVDKKPALKMRLIDKTNVYFSDEQNPNINEQEYIILSERIPVEKAKRTAKEAGISDDEIAMITSDQDTDDDIGQEYEHEVKSESGKCTSLLYMRMTKEGLSFCRSTQSVIYQPEQTIAGLDVYPLVGMRWEERKGDSRGESAVRQMIPNQIEVNRTAARRAVAVKRFAFPIKVYDESRITNPKALDSPGASIAVKELGQNPIERFIQYLNPTAISPDAANLQSEMIERTQQLEGAGDAALGQVNPENASGEAIKAARDQAAVPLNEQSSSYKQFIEDMALLWYKLWVVYSPYGMQVNYDGPEGTETEVIPQDVLIGMDVDIRIDISPVDPYSKLARETALGNLLGQQLITFEEYVGSLSDDSSVPKARLEEILSARQKQRDNQDEIDAGLVNLSSSLGIPVEQLIQMMGGTEGAEAEVGTMPEMQNGAGQNEIIRV